MKNFASGICILAALGITAYTAIRLPLPATHQSAPQSVPGITASGGTMNLVCTGNLEHLITAGAGSAEAAGIQDPNTRHLAGGFIFPARSETKTAANLIPKGIVWHPSIVKDSSAPEGSPAASENAGGATNSGEPLTKQVISSFAAESTASAPQPDLRGFFAISRNEANADVLAVNNIHRAEAGDLRGLASNPCTWATNSAWFVGLKAGVGISNQLRLINPSANPLVVQMEAFNALGKTQVGANANIALAPGAMKTVSLTGILQTNAQISLHLSSSTGLFGAAVQTSALAGLTAQGIDFQKPAATGTSLIIPGLFLPPAKNTINNDGKPLVDLGDAPPPGPAPSGNAPPNPPADPAPQAEKLPASQLVEADFSATLRMVNPGETSKHVSVYLIPESGAPQLLAGAEKVLLAPGVVFDLSLSGLQAGAYAIQLISDGEITGGIETISGKDPGARDIAWLAAQNPLTSSGAAFSGGHGTLIISTVKSSPENTPRQNPHNAASSTHGTWIAYDALGKQIATEKFAISATALAADEMPQQVATETVGTLAIPLPDHAAFVALEADAPIYAAISVSSHVGDARLLDWVPFTAGIAATAEVQIKVRN
ncbi:hypothetical protein J2S36_000808 [Arcanobacterium hippocoleae]|uniref:Uncharacterized protein n=2 Tax=Arcanobacterium hippocoleae TaxID=149017 RepID=A0ABU1T1M0_9ACTO|nr:DUF5719 family protein [Arcanobacterium hippocoleae]MDR6939265.1 hypothetical protein [Arcanobacterium hippocoleae]